MADSDNQEVYQLVQQLIDPANRETALVELSKKRESVVDLAPILWYSVGTMSVCI